MKRTKQDIALSDKLLTETPYCQRCGASPENGRCKRLNAAHVISRSRKGTRYDERNVFVLCVACHFATAKDPYGFVLWLQKTGLMSVEDYEDLRFLAGIKTPVFEA